MVASPHNCEVLDINQIKQYLPHRYPFLLVDRVLSWKSGQSIRALKNVTTNEAFFNGHFPNKSVMPGVMIIEALAQTAALLSFLTAQRQPDENTMVYFVGIDKARFRRPVEPGDQLILETKLIRTTRSLRKYCAYALVDGKVAVETEFMCTLRYLDENISASSY